MKKPEVTGKKVAAIAGRVLERIGKLPPKHNLVWVMWSEGDALVNLEDLKALAASALTQAKDRPKRKAAK